MARGPYLTPDGVGECPVVASKVVPATYARLQDLAERTGTTKSALIRQAIETFLAEAEEVDVLEVALAS